MILINGQPFFDFDALVDTTPLDSMRPFISAFIARNTHRVKPVKYISDIFEQQEKGIWDHVLEFRDNPESVSDLRLRQEIQQLIDSDQFGHFIIFERPVTTGCHVIASRWARDYRFKQRPEDVEPIPEDDQLRFFYDWIEQQDIFETYGRLNIFINFSNMYTYPHRDYPVKDRETLETSPDEFIWITFNPAKKIYVLDRDTGEKHYSQSQCVWFNTGNWHGTDAVPLDCYSIRVDGVFNDRVRSQISVTNTKESR